MTRTSMILYTLFFVCLALPGNAAATDYEVRVGAAHSDNIARTNLDQIEETYALLGVVLDSEYESPKLEASLVTDLEYRSYLDDTFDSEVIGSLNADVLIKFIPESFLWTISNRFGNLQSNPFLPDSPSNRGNVNVFSTGPDFRVRLGSNTAIELGGRYDVERFEDDLLNNDVTSGRLALVRAMSTHRTISINLRTDRVEFEDLVANSSYDRQAAYLAFNSETSRGFLGINLGYNELHDSGTTVGGSLILLSLERELTSSTTLNVFYNQSLTSAGDTLTRLQDSDMQFGILQQTAAVGDPFRNKRFEVGIDYERGSDSFELSALHNEDKYVTLGGLDSDRTELRGQYSRALGANWRLNFNGSFQSTEFRESQRKDDDILFSVGLSLRLSRVLAVNVDFARVDRDSSDAAFDYVENVTALTFSYERQSNSP